ncbi:MAG TPA: magnesium transporter [Vicinamibacteria bacterium]|nr:magnesium transporter [Vicinamibacteria bacterium]
MAGAVRALVEKALEIEPERVADAIETATLEEAKRLVADYPGPHWTKVLPALSSERATAILEAIPTEAGGVLLESLDVSTAAAMVSRLSPEARERLLGAVKRSVASELNTLLEFPHNTAGRLMDPRVMTFGPRTTAGQVLDQIRSSQKRVFEVFVVDAQGVLLGTVPMQEIAVAPASESIGELQRPPTSIVRAMSTREEVVEILETKKTPALPVVDFSGRLLGVIRYDALIAATQEEASVDIQTMVGASKEERALSKVHFAVRKRLPWLQVNLGTAFLAASVVGIFESIIAQFTALAVLLPVVAGQSGNTGAQALAVTMRGLALREIQVRHWLAVIFKEFRVGLLNGVAVAATTSAFVFLWSRSIGLALVIGISMVLSMALAGLSGGAIPMVLTALGQDPAQSSSIILTTVTDVVGFFSFLGIATLLASTL